jgi:hypothetical protein
MGVGFWGGGEGGALWIDFLQSRTCSTYWEKIKAYLSSHLVGVSLRFEKWVLLRSVETHSDEKHLSCKYRYCNKVYLSTHTQTGIYGMRNDSICLRPLYKTASWLGSVGCAFRLVLDQWLYSVFRSGPLQNVGGSEAHFVELHYNSTRIRYVYTGKIILMSLNFEQLYPSKFF